MKKFLTVLLALSVVFTYTVGTAFAATDPNADYKAKVSDAAKLAQNDLNSKYDEAVIGIADKAVEGATVEAKYWKAAAADWKKNQDKILDLRKDEILGQFSTFGSKNISELKAYFALGKGDKSTGYEFKSEGVTEPTANTITGDTSVIEAAATAKFKDVKNEALRVVGLVDLSVYSTTIQTVGSVENTSHYAVAKDVIDKILNAIRDINLAVPFAGTDFKAKIDQIGITAVHNKSQGSGALQNVAKVENEFYEIYQIRQSHAKSLGLKTIKEEGGETITLEAAKIEKNAEIDKAVATFLKDNVNAADYTTVIKPLADAYSLSQKYLVSVAEKVADTADVIDLTDVQIVSLDKTTHAYFGTNVESIKTLEAFAAKYKLEKDATGKLIRDGEAVDAIVKKAKAAAYMATAEWAGLDAAKTEIINCTIATAKDAYTTEKAKFDVEEARKAALKDYYDLEAAKVNERYDALIKAIDDAKNTAEVTKAADKIKSPATLLAGIAKDDEVRRNVAALSEYTILESKLQLVMDGENIGKTGTDRKDYNFFTAEYLQNYIGESGARTGAEVAALYTKLEAELKAVKPIKDVDAAIAAADALIGNLPDTIKEADAAAVEAAWKAAVALKDVHPGAVPTKANELANAVKQLAAVEKQSVNKAIYDLSQIVNPDKDAVKAVIDKANAYNDKFEEDGIYESIPSNQKVNVSALEAKLNTFRADALKKVLEAINAIPVTVTLDDKSVVESARAAYDAFVAEYTSYEGTGYDAVSAVTNKKELFLAEAEIEALESNYNEYLKTGVKGTHIKIFSKAYKKYTKISWKKELGFKVDGYEVYRATKRNGKFTKIWTAKSSAKSVNNTKNRKKGTTYFYKLRGFRTIGGEKVYTHWSITVARKAK